MPTQNNHGEDTAKWRARFTNLRSADGYHQGTHTRPATPNEETKIMQHRSILSDGEFRRQTKILTP